MLLATAAILILSVEGPHGLENCPEVLGHGTVGISGTIMRCVSLMISAPDMHPETAFRGAYLGYLSGALSN
jgi:hypothetical protein